MTPPELASAVQPDREGASRPQHADARAPSSAADLVAQIERHHGCERRALPYLVALLAKVAGFHGRRNPKLGVLCDAGQELAETIEGRLDDEERELFPALLSGPPEAARGGLDQLRRHHRALTLLLARVRWLADDFAVPPWAGRSYQILMEELAALEEDVVAHMALEGALLGPPAA
jgi:regulator of cell morphogenesis and NO signaling